ncbi:MAG: hypothetical protein ACOCWO_04015 [Candidatus Muiribacteriaceae bacterium]
MDIDKLIDFEVEDTIRTGSYFTDKLLRPLFRLVPQTIYRKISLLSPYHVFLACISRFSFGLFLGSTFPNFFKRHRIKLLVLGIITSIPLLKILLYEDK